MGTIAVLTKVGRCGCRDSKIVGRGTELGLLIANPSFISSAFAHIDSGRKRLLCQWMGSNSCQGLVIG